ncbi:MAG: hypothetical protein ACKOQM_00040 [Novosphingobium sp.]
MIRAVISVATAALVLTGCVTTRVNEDGSTEARLGQTVNLGGPRVTPLAVLEDSRCPMEARCIWAGRVRLSVRVTTGAGTSVQELASDKPLPVADGQLELMNVMPPRSVQHAIRTSDYRFTLRFSGGF